MSLITLNKCPYVWMTMSQVQQVTDQNLPRLVPGLGFGVLYG